MTGRLVRGAASPNPGRTTAAAAASGASEVAGCTAPDAMNHNPFATDDDGSCIMALQPGCTYSEASNFNDAADYDDGSCTFGASPVTCPADVDEDGTVAVADLLIILGAFGESCIPE